MAVTVDLVKKLILEYIGGKPLFGNPGNVWAGKHLVTIQIPHLGALGSLTGTLGSLVNQAESLTSAISQLVQNPLGALTGQINSLAGGLLSQVSAIAGLPGGALSQITSAVSTLQTSAQGLLDHTNILSGVTQDIETIGTSALGPSELMKLPDASDVTQLAGALFSDNQVDSIRQSLDPGVPGGVTAILNLLASATTTNDQNQLASILSKQLTDHATQLDTIVANDQAATNQYLLTQSVVAGTHSLLPDATNEGQNLLFNRIATPTLKTISSQFPDDVRDQNDINDAVVTNQSVSTVIPQSAPITQVPPHSHPTSDIVSFLVSIQQELQILSHVVTQQDGVSYTAQLSDADSYIQFTNSDPVSFTIPPNSSVAFPIGTIIEMEETGTGALTVVAGDGVTINSRAADLTLAGQYAVAFVKKVATDTWTMNGDL